LSRHHLSVGITHIFMLWIHKRKAHWFIICGLLIWVLQCGSVCQLHYWW
jgi:hypothetical protein